MRFALALISLSLFAQGDSNPVRIELPSGRKFVSVVYPEGPIILVRKVRPGERSEAKITEELVSFQAELKSVTEPGIGQVQVISPQLMTLEFQERLGEYWKPAYPQNVATSIQILQLVNPQWMSPELYTTENFNRLITRKLPKGKKLTHYFPPIRFMAGASGTGVFQRQYFASTKPYTLLRVAKTGESADLYEAYACLLIRGKLELLILEILEEVF